MSGDEDNESGSGGSDVQSEVLSERQMEYNLKMARERRKTLKLELALANSASRSREPSPAGSASQRGRNNGLRYHAKMLAGAFQKFPTDAEKPIWFESVESTLLAYEVPKEFWGQIVFPIIAERVEYLSTRLTPAQHRDYESVKEVVLEELRLSPLEYQKRFLGARKRKSETWKSFTTRLRSYLNFYGEARGVSTFEKLLDLLVADQLKTGLTEEALKYVRLREGASWFDASESAKLLQTFEGAAGNKDASAEANVTNGEKPATKPSGDNPKGARKLPQGPKTRFNQQSKGKPNACFECGAEGHLRPNCPRVRERQTAATNAPARTERLIARSSIRYLGHVVGSGKHGPDPAKLEAIKGLKVPQTKKELRSALGLCGYYRDYVPNFAAIAKPLTQLTTKGTPSRIPWSTEADHSFKMIKRALCEATSLTTPDITKPFWLFTDASAIAAGACLAQLTDDGKELPIAFASHRFTPTQSRWSTIEREAFAVIWGLRKFDTWVFGAQVIVVSDHNPLSYLTQTVPQGAKLTRWALALQRYNIVVKHRKGEPHANADTLFRLPNECWNEAQ
ncbi:uncharacterized protein LOC144179802 [Haemaphysalis longicornis]